MPTQKTGNSPTSSSQDDFMRWTAQNERSRAISNYTDILKDADQRSMLQVENFTGQVERIYKGTLAVYIVTLVVVSLVFIISVALLLIPGVNDFQRLLGTIGIPVSLVILLLLVYRAPLKPARQIVGEVIKMQVIYLGYLRQVNQVDIGFKQSFASTEKMSSEQLQESFSQTQQIMGKAIDDINLLLEDLS